MGLGKTIQGLAVASFYKDEWPVFIIGKIFFSSSLKTDQNGHSEHFFLHFRPQIGVLQAEISLKSIF
jgi:hypothetical protein